jgi:Cof subfamily protein (haloacid dehalogenase superfamily)
VSERNRAALARAHEHGAEIVLVTARPPWWIQELAPEASDVAICCNGAVLWDLHGQRVLSDYALQPSAAARIVATLRERAPGVAFACERAGGAIREPAYVPLWPSPDQHPRTDALEFVAEPVFKLVAQHPTLTQLELYELALELCGEEATVTYSGELLVEISAAGVTKAFALAAHCAELGIRPEDVVAFGDMPNDVPLLRFAGLGVAVANAHPDALAASDEVTASNDEDGVARVLERLFD